MAETEKKAGVKGSAGEIPFASIEEALEEIRRGRMIVVCDGEDRENEGDLVMAAQFATPEAINFMAKEGRGLICLALTPDRCDELGLDLMAAKNESPFQTPFTVSIEARDGVTTGISAADRAQTIQVAIDPTTVRAAGLPYDYLHTQMMTFTRGLDIQVTAVVAVCLMAAITAFTVFMQPLRDLLFGAGGLILGVWGIRGLLVPSNITFTTMVDIGLGLVIGFLLAAIIWRELLYLVQRNQLRLPWSPTPLAAPADPQRPTGAAPVARCDDPPERETEPG
jgi:3,4-dihydroxy-2-butanone 4-phosphate synthase